MHLVVMGVSGTGKTTVAMRLQTLLGWTFLEGDSLHPVTNVARMAAGHPLTDADREPWLQALAAWSATQHTAGRPSILTCSSLRRRYRDVLTAGAPGTFFVHLVGDPAVLLARMQGRQHFMPASMLDSQLATLEPLQADEQGEEFDVAEPPDLVARRVMGHLGLRPHADADADAVDGVGRLGDGPDRGASGRG